MAIKIGGTTVVNDTCELTNIKNYNSAGGNFFAGMCAGYSNTTGSNNNFFGKYAGLSNTTGNLNTFIGRFAGYCNTTGSCNNFIGQFAGCRNTTGSNNNFIGTCAGFSNTSGSCNIFIGMYAGRNNTTGINNLYMGNTVGFSASNGSNNILIGCGAGYSTGGLANITTESNRIILGNNAHTCAQIQIAWTVVSDCRDKCIFGRVPHGRGFLQNLETIEYAFKDRETGCLTDVEGKRRYGFSAQNVLQAEGDHPVVVSADNSEKLQMTHEYMIPILVNAINELSTEVDDLKARVLALESK